MTSLYNSPNKESFWNLVSYPIFLPVFILSSDLVSDSANLSSIELLSLFLGFINVFLNQLPQLFQKAVAKLGVD